MRRPRAERALRPGRAVELPAAAPSGLFALSGAAGSRTSKTRPLD